MNRGTTIGWLALAAVTVLSGCDIGTLTPQSQQQLDAALAAYQQGDDRQTIMSANAVLAQTTRGEGAMQAYYLRGMAHFRQGAYDDARHDLDIVNRRSDDDALRARALETLGEIAYRQDLTPLAIGHFRDALELIPDGQPPADVIRYRLGCAMQKVGRWQDADVHFSRVMHFFPDSEVARRSEDRMGSRAWTIQVEAYREMGNAEHQADIWRQRGFEVYITPDTTAENRLLYRLQVGRWNTYEPAADMLPGVRQHKHDAFLQVTR